MLPIGQSQLQSEYLLPVISIFVAAGAIDALFQVHQISKHHRIVTLYLRVLEHFFLFLFLILWFMAILFVYLFETKTLNT